VGGVSEEHQNLEKKGRKERKNSAPPCDMKRRKEIGNREALILKKTQRGHNEEEDKKGEGEKRSPDQVGKQTRREENQTNKNKKNNTPKSCGDPWDYLLL